MCLAIPMRLEQITGIRATASIEGNTLEIGVALVPDARVGDWVLVHAGCAITKLDEDEARRTYELLHEAARLQDDQP